MTSATLRQRIFETRGEACERCGRTEQLHLHHLTYTRYGHEVEADLQILCVDCHQVVHLLASKPRRRGGGGTHPLSTSMLNTRPDTIPYSHFRRKL